WRVLLAERETRTATAPARREHAIGATRRGDPHGYHSPVRRRASLLLFAVVIGAAAASAVSTPAGARVADAGGPGQLIRPGAQPRAPLRLTPAAASVSRSLTFGTQVTRSGISTGTVGPLQIRTLITAMVHSAGPNGTIR